MMYANSAITECTSNLILVTSPVSERVHDVITIRAARSQLSSLSVVLKTINEVKVDRHQKTQKWHYEKMPERGSKMPVM